MHSSSIGCPIYFPCLLQFCIGYCIWHTARVWKRKTSEKRWFSHSKKYPDTTNTFSLFLDEFLETDLRPIYCSLTTGGKSGNLWGLRRSESECVLKNVHHFLKYFLCVCIHVMRIESRPTIRRNRQFVFITDCVSMTQSVNSRKQKQK